MWGTSAGAWTVKGRIDGATEAAAQGVPYKLLQRLGGWTSHEPMPPEHTLYINTNEDWPTVAAAGWVVPNWSRSNVPGGQKLLAGVGGSWLASWSSWSGQLWLLQDEKERNHRIALPTAIMPCKDYCSRKFATGGMWGECY